jgi:hypothetical protein
MTTLEAIAGGAKSGTLYGIGVGPGDVRYMTLRAVGLVRSVDVLAYFAKRGHEGNARKIVAPLINGAHRELNELYTDDRRRRAACHRRHRQFLPSGADARQNPAGAIIVGRGRPSSSQLFTCGIGPARVPVEVVPGQASGCGRGHLPSPKRR